MIVLPSARRTVESVFSMLKKELSIDLEKINPSDDDLLFLPHFDLYYKMIIQNNNDLELLTLLRTLLLSRSHLP